MSNDVSFSLSSILSDFGAARRADQKKGETGMVAGSDEPETPFRRMLPDENAKAVPAKRGVNRRSAPGQISREDQIRAQSKSLQQADRTIAEEKAKPQPSGEKPQSSGTRAESTSQRPVDRREKEVAAERESTDGTNTADTTTAKPASEPVEAAKIGENAAPEHVSDAQVATVDAEAVSATALIAEAASAIIDPEAIAIPVAAAGPSEGEQGAAVETDEMLLGVQGSGTKTANAELAAALKDAAKLGEDGEKVAEAGEDMPQAKGKASEALGQQVAAKAEEARATQTQEGEQAIGEKVSAFVSKGKGEEAEALNGSRKGQPSLHPQRATPFGELLEGFSHNAAIHRPIDILAGLDRQVAAAALNRQSHEIQRPTPIQMLPVEIGMQAVRGVTNFQIRLDPAELGRVDVNLQIRDNGEVHANLVVDRVETLAMLKRDASTLEYAFEQAGLRQSADGLSFSLRGEGQQGQKQEGEGSRAGHDAHGDAELQAQIGEAAMRRVLIPNSSVDLMV